MNVHELYEKLNEMIPPELSCDWDNDGLMVESVPRKEVKSALVSLDVSRGAVKKAKEIGADVIVSHHPLIFRPLKNLSHSGIQTEKIIECIREDIAVMSFHTRLDALGGGVNDVLAQRLHLKRTEPLGGMGRIGYLESPMKLGGFVNLVERELGCRCTAYPGNSDVYKVGVLGGDGKDLAWDAVEAGCDTYLTGDVGYNTALDVSDAGVNCIEAGHFFTEDPVCCVLCEMLEGLGIEAQIYNSNPQLK